MNPKCQMEKGNGRIARLYEPEMPDGEEIRSRRHVLRQFQSSLMLFIFLQWDKNRKDYHNELKNKTGHRIFH